ncbi:OmpH family outer membrane protein [Hymenobacter properus]|uniref:OmpH family outer membrane protein n=1 Tax=Hymenobacter properus TaxID=2791026 RepID=A0A931FM82_9BACT|nr:OmpH family outer membrane protein [Hymenobacter properus]MBF9143670.1 OmpH family outer membrane protein [Hymenobacter properus]MBR7722483.1 OmpH family outer membrane protein [Microvirga sp. SRT04]
MKNPIQLTINVVLALLVAGLYFLHFNQKPVAPAIATDKSTAVVASPELNTADTTAAATTETAAAPVAETGTPAAAAVSSEGKIAYVESSKMLDGYQGMKDARKSFEAKARGWESQNQKLIANFRTAVENYQKQAQGMTAEQRAATEQKLQAQQQESGQAQQRIQAQAQEEEAKLTQTVLESVNKKVEAYGKAHGYKLILIAAPSGTIAYGQKDLDITAPVLAYLNAEYRKK